MEKKPPETGRNKARAFEFSFMMRLLKKYSVFINFMETKKNELT